MMEYHMMEFFMRFLVSSVKTRSSDVVTRGILDLARFVLTRNFFEFDSHFYIQKSGTATGTVMAVA